MSAARTKTSRFLSSARDELYHAWGSSKTEAMTPEQRHYVLGILLLLEDEIKDIRNALDFSPNKDFSDVPATAA